MRSSEPFHRARACSPVLAKHRSQILRVHLALARSRAIVSLLLVILALPSDTLAADAEDSTPLNVRLSRNGEIVLVHFDVTSSFTERFRRRVAGGITSRVVIDILLEDNQRRPLASRRRDCRVRLDIWDDKVFTRIDDDNPPRRATFLLLDDALDACGVVDALPLVDVSQLGTRSGYRVLIKVMLNPVPPELLEKTREFTWNPSGSPPGRGRAVIGAVAKLFRSDTESGDEAFYFRSQSLERPVRKDR